MLLASVGLSGGALWSLSAVNDTVSLTFILSLARAICHIDRLHGKVRSCRLKFIFV